MRSRNPRLMIPALFFLAPFAARGVEPAPAAVVARQTIAALLKIPVADPDVSVTVRGVKEEDGLIIEDIFWESLDNERPIAYVIRPAKPAAQRLPAIIYLHGSSGSRDSESTKTFAVGQWTNANGKTGTGLRGSARELARRGYLTLALTQRGLDARGPSTEDQTKDMLIRGRVLMGAIVYEIRQAVTYLARRQDVDPQKIGMSGLSFGGITTFYTWLVDFRIAAAAPICGGVGSLDVLARRGSRAYHGIYWWIPNMLTKGDQGDFAAAMAPRPLMLWGPTEDIGMPKEGVDRFVAAVRPAYEKMGAGGSFAAYQRPGVHELSTEAFELMVKFFDAWLRK